MSAILYTPPRGIELLLMHKVPLHPPCEAVGLAYTTLMHIGIIGLPGDHNPKRYITSICCEKVGLVEIW